MYQIILDLLGLLQVNSFSYNSCVLSLALDINLIFEYSFVSQTDKVLSSQ